MVAVCTRGVVEVLYDAFWASRHFTVGEKVLVVADKIHQTREGTLLVDDNVSNSALLFLLGQADVGRCQLGGPLLQHVLQDVPGHLLDPLLDDPVGDEDARHSVHVVTGKRRDDQLDCTTSSVYLKPLYQARESSLVPLHLLTVHFLQKTYVYEAFVTVCL